ncbi:hypothetical protein KSS87_016265 [Heliosperma pusillum]|nr:hypothetical protein KSS87_003587 [Heliosperma pusillum]KAH9616215.1 hypothetical protein KSS87_016265 [Heliosperma pusillum]
MENMLPNFQKFLAPYVVHKDKIHYSKILFNITTKGSYLDNNCSFNNEKKYPALYLRLTAS